MQLILTFGDNSTQTIAISTDMIEELPDMSTEGEKTIVINYNGNTYTFRFNVSLNELTRARNEYMAKLQQFL